MMATAAERLRRWLIMVAVLLLGADVVLTCVEVFSRYLFRVSHGWTEEVQRWLMVWAVWLLVGPVMDMQRHISMTLLPDKLGAKGKRIHRVLESLVMLGACSFVGWLGILWVLDVKKSGELSAYSPMPIWITYLVFVIGMGLAVLFSLKSLFVYEKKPG